MRKALGVPQRRAGDKIVSDERTRNTAAFYDEYWPKNVPNADRTRAHIRSIVPPGSYRRALDGGCGTGVCSLSLSEIADSVVGLDISQGSLETARDLAQSKKCDNLTFCRASLLELPFDEGSFDLVLSWGVIHHTVSPIQALDELVRVLQPGGTLVLAVYLKTALTPVHEAIRRACLKLPPSLGRVSIRLGAGVVRLAQRLGYSNNVRDDNDRIESQVEDWYFVPEKHFFSIREMEELFTQRRLTFELACSQTGRFRSSSNFIVLGRKVEETWLNLSGV